MLTTMNWKEVSKADAVAILNRAEIFLTEDEIRNCETAESVGRLYYETVADNTAWMLDMKTHARTHKGLERGCFWTDWEGGEE